MLPLLLSGSCGNELIEFEKGDLKIVVVGGDAWLHDYPLFLGMKKKNPPQLAVWIENTEGQYVATVYATHKIATQSWQAAGSNRRKEALPHWCYSRGVRYPDGLYLPTKRQPLTDGISGATPRESFSMKLTPGPALERFVVKAEVNHSTDFNAAYPENARAGDPGYSGGSEGSGQPALVYAALVDLKSGLREFEAVPVGHSSPDGTTGELDADLSGLTSAHRIVKRITVNVQ